MVFNNQMRDEHMPEFTEPLTCSVLKSSPDKKVSELADAASFVDGASQCLESNRDIGGQTP